MKIIAVTLVLLAIAIFYFAGHSTSSPEPVEKPEITSAIPQNQETLLPFLKGRLWGYINKNGDVVIDPQFHSASDFHEGLAHVSIGKYPQFADECFINTAGEYVLRFDFSHHFGSFSEGLASVEVDDKRGFINKKGEFVIEPQYEFTYPFSEGFALVGDWREGPWGYCDDDGKFVYVPELNVGKEDDINKYWFIDTTGEIAFGRWFESAQDFSEGLACVDIDGEKVYINYSGEIVLEPGFDGAGPFSEGMATVSTGEWPTAKVGFIDRTGECVIEPQYGSANQFSEGLTGVMVGGWQDGKWGFINKEGEFVIEPVFDGVASFSEGLAVVRIGNWDTGKSGFINKKGEFVIEPVFDQARSFSNGLATVHVNADYGPDEKPMYNYYIGYIDKTGKYVWGPSN